MTNRAGWKVSGALVLTLVLVACANADPAAGDETTTTAVEATTTDAAETTTTTAAPETTTTTAATTTTTEAAPTAAEDLVGTWVNPNGATWEVADDGSVSVLGGVVSGFTYTATSTTIELVDQPGPSACPQDQPGTYEWEIDTDTLTLNAVSDECTGRRGALDGISFERDE